MELGAWSSELEKCEGESLTTAEAMRHNPQANDSDGMKIMITRGLEQGAGSKEQEVSEAKLGSGAGFQGAAESEEHFALLFQFFE